MEKNYLSSAYLAHAVWKRWTTVSTDNVEDRHLILTGSTAALISLPGYDAYSPTKAAIRSLADILRQEALMYLSTTRINVHCSLPGTIYTESFYREQRRKPPLLKRLEGSEDNTGGQDAGTIARGILQGVERGDFFITTDFNTQLLLNNMRGPSPHNSRFPLVDWCLGWIMSLVWPILRMYFDRVVRTEGTARVGVEPTKSEPHRGSVSEGAKYRLSHTTTPTMRRGHDDDGTIDYACIRSRGPQCCHCPPCS